MWLLDHNVPRKIRPLLKHLGQDSAHAVDKGWDTLENGALVTQAVQSGYTVILTRDTKFQYAAKTSLINFPNVCIVLLRLHQADAKIYVTSFSAAWKKSPIVPKPGQVIEWPI
jgi:hypothetical protein